MLVGGIVVVFIGFYEGVIDMQVFARGRSGSADFPFSKAGDHVSEGDGGIK